MTKNEDKRLIPRESDNPIVEEYKEDLMRKPLSTVRDEERLICLEGLVSELHGKVDSLEQRVRTLEEKR
jgi:hypothetical protein